jgi:hypothetical protein
LPKKFFGKLYLLAYAEAPSLIKARLMTTRWI